MWKRNVAIGLTAVLSVTSIVFAVVNNSQQKRIAALEQVRNTTTEEVETEIQRYLNSNAFQFVGEAAEDSGVDMESLITDSIGDVIEKTDEGYLVSVRLTEEQSSAIASQVADTAYETLSQNVLQNKSDIDTEKLETEVATAVTNTLAQYLSEQDKEYVTVNGNEAAIVNQVIEKLSAQGINTGTSGSESTKAVMTREEIEALVTQLVNNSSVTKDNVDSFEESLINATVEYLRQYNLIKAGKDGKDGEDGVTPQKGVDYFTEKEITSMSETIMTTITQDGLNVYGTQGVGIYDAEVDDATGELTFTLHDGELDEDGNYANVEKVTVDNFTDGNGIKYMNIEDTGNNSYDVYYYMEYKTDISDSEITKDSTNGMRYVIERTGGEVTGVHKYDSSVDTVDSEIAYRYKAGSLTVSADTINNIIGNATTSIITTLNKELGAEAGKIVQTLDTVKTEVTKLQEVINGKDDGTVGISALTSGKTTSTAEDGTQTVTWDKNSFGWVAEQLNIMMGENGGGEASVNELKNQAEKIETFGKLNETAHIEITADDVNSATLDGEYYVVTKTLTNTNKNPDFSWTGNNSSDSVPNNEQTRIASFCKFIKVDAENDTVSFYFAKNAENKIEATESIFIEFRSISFENDGVSILTNQTTDNYGYVRQSDEVREVNGQNVVKLDGGYLAVRNGQNVVSVTIE